MPKIRKVRLSVTVPPRQREYLDKIVDTTEYSLAELVEHLLDVAIQARESQKVGA